MRIASLASGSRGNCIYIETSRGSLIVDAGISVKSIKSRAAERGIDLGLVSAILITHEHSDHISGMGRLSCDLNIPVYCHSSTHEAIGGKQRDYIYAGDNAHYESGFVHNGINIKPFRTPHDAAYSCGYRIECEGVSVAIATDLGLVNNGVMSNLEGSDIVMLESNHDIDMLKGCGYPPHLIKRILGSNGHLSNELCATAVRRLYERGTRRFMLGHLSANSNLTRLAYAATQHELADVDGDEYILTVAEQDAPSKFIEIKE